MVVYQSFAILNSCWSLVACVVVIGRHSQVGRLHDAPDEIVSPFINHTSLSTLPDDIIRRNSALRFDRKPDGLLRQSPIDNAVQFSFPEKKTAVPC